MTGFSCRQVEETYPASESAAVGALVMIGALVQVHAVSASPP